MKCDQCDGSGWLAPVPGEIEATLLYGLGGTDHSPRKIPPTGESSDMVDVQIRDRCPACKEKARRKRHERGGAVENRA